MEPLSVEDFRPFFKALNDGQAPFPWQERLARLVVESGWPAVLDLPTGAGKTATLDIAIFHLALELSRSTGARRAARRIVYVVDRRLIVDQAHARANRAAEKLACATDGHLRRVADALREGGTGHPLRAVPLRGGIHRDPGWLRRPDEPVIVLSTVDQVGSRLLFRGYGLSDSMRPIHAGLLGSDALFLLDEVHLSRPFEETLSAISMYRKWAQEGVEVPWAVVRLSATPGPGKEGDREPFRLGGDDRDTAVCEPLCRRLAAHKPVRLREVSRSGRAHAGSRSPLAMACAEEAKKLVREGANAVAVMVNRVATARDARDACARLLEGQAEVELITGRMRPLDRQRIEGRLVERVRAGRDRNALDRPFVVVATQCLEAGADLDFDGLVTECASIDSLRQRFGRLDRLGRNAKARAVVLVSAGDLEGDPDPVYGLALERTWRWMTEHAEELDFGSDYLQLPAGKELEQLLGPARHAPVLLPAHLDALCQTNPGPAVEPDVALWLHGSEPGSADVNVIWRADVPAVTLERGRAPEAVLSALGFCPPGADEALPVPLFAARAWLEAGQGALAVADMSDVEGESPAASEESPGEHATVIRWRGDDTDVISPSEIRPGDTIVVSIDRGGLRAAVWDPGAQPDPDLNAPPVPIRDWGDVVQLRQRGVVILRLNPGVLGSLGLPEFSFARDAEDEEEGPAAAAGDVLDAFAAWRERAVASARERDDAPVLALLEAAGEAIRQRALRATKTEDGCRAVISRPGFSLHVDPAASGEVSSEPDVSSFTAVEVSLADHGVHVGCRAEEYARRAGFPEGLAADIGHAGLLHDTGKADPRFQALLRGGSEVEVAAGAQLLAKSAVSHRDLARRRAAQSASGYPTGTRHEILSCALVEGAVTDGTLEASDPDLVLHLIASHHGHARPFAPPVRDPEPREVCLEYASLVLRARTDHSLARVDSPVPERFWRLTRRYGWWGLAHCEALLRLADHRCSEEETRGGRG